MDLCQVARKAVSEGIDPQDVMKMRWVLSIKESGKCKARIVIQGYTDPQLGQIDVASPTLSKRARHVFLTMCAHYGFRAQKADVSAAFLQGDWLPENRRLKVKPVPELAEALGLEVGELVELLKGAYGLGDAPKLWFLKGS